MSDKLKVAVYCSAKDNLSDTCKIMARDLGAAIGRLGCELVYGGVDAGLMREVASAASASGAKVIGVVPRLRLAQASPLNDELIEVDGLSQRKEVMQSLATVFVILPGGYGTLDEFLSAYAYINFNNLDRSIIVCNSDGVFDGILTQLDAAAQSGLMDGRCNTCVSVATKSAEMTKILESLITKIRNEK